MLEMMRKYLLGALASVVCLGGVLGAEDSRITIHTRSSEGSIAFYADSSAFCPQRLEFQFQTLEGYTCAAPLPVAVEVPARSRDTLVCSIKEQKTSGQRNYAYFYEANLGDPGLLPDPDAEYFFPFDHGTKHQVTQGFNGSFSHSGLNRFAVDFGMPEGTPVRAARDGVVVDVKEDSSRGGNDPALLNEANFVRVYHADGTWASYVHLKFQGARVKEGDVVHGGDLIGYSGNTGYSVGPHLHIDLRSLDKEGKVQAVPLRFADASGIAVEALAGKWYYASFPGLPDFDAVLGDRLRNEDFAAAISSVPEGSEPEIRAEQVDSTIILYIRNRLPKNLEFQVSLNLTNFKSSKPVPITLRVPAKTEMFLALLFAIDPLAEARYKVTWAYR